MKKGFTLVELLVVIAIIGILSTLSVVSLNSARAKSRDARRLSDIKQIRTALDMYYDASSTYPTTSCTSTPLGTGNCACLTSVGWTNTSTTNCTGTIFMQKVPSDPLSSGAYTYTSTSSGQSYEIVYKLEANSGNSTATPSSMGN